MLMVILVTGGAGFIGNHLCERLLKAGNRVVCVDNFVTGDKKNISPLMDDPNFRLIEHDITVPLDYSGEKIDQIYHLASIASPVDYKALPLQTLWVNSIGTKNALDLAVKNKARFLFTSSSEVYGNPLEHPQKESYNGNNNPVGERSCYSEGKRFSESICINYYRQFGIPLKIVRIFNTYGPKMKKHDGRAVPEFILKALKNEPLEVAGDGKQTRSFCFIEDLLDGLTGFMATEDALTGPVNLGNPDEYSIEELAKIIIRLSASSSQINHVARSGDDPEKRKPDITLAMNSFGFKPKIGLEDGLNMTIQYFKNNQ